MRNIIIILLFIFFTQSINAEGIEAGVVDDIRLLSPEEQVHTIIETFKHYERYTRIVSFAECIDILAENPEGVKPVLFRYFKELNPRLPRDLSDMRYRIIDDIIWERFYLRNKLFTEDEKELLAELYQEKLDYYLKTYQRVDEVVYRLDFYITDFRTGIGMPYTEEYKRYLVKKYTDLGYKDLRYGF